MSAESLLLKSRTALLMEQPFFGTLAVRLKPVADDSIKTAATDGQRLIYSPKYIEKLSPHQLKGLIAHEVMHCVFNHMTRRQDRDPEIWNSACDYAINSHLLDCGFILPDGGLVDPGLSGLTAEEIYNRISNEPPKPCAWGKVLDAGVGAVNGKSNAALESDWQVATTEAAEVAKQRGKLPGKLASFISEIINPKVDWRTVLWPFFTNLINDDYSWRKPNRAYISEDEYLPSMHSEGCGPVAVVIDSSGSTAQYYQQFASELDAVLGDVNPESVQVVVGDTQVTDSFTLDQGSRLTELEIKGGGGTVLAPLFQHIDDPNNAAVICLTDLEMHDCDWEDIAKLDLPPTLWVSTNRSLEAPIGSTIYI
jgi:predicted metal-dependent peptidase